MSVDEAVVRALAIGPDSSTVAHTIDITTLGARSGASRRIEIWFHRVDGRCLLRPRWTLGLEKVGSPSNPHGGWGNPRSRDRWSMRRDRRTRLHSSRSDYRGWIRRRSGLLGPRYLGEQEEIQSTCVRKERVLGSGCFRGYIRSWKVWPASKKRDHKGLGCWTARIPSRMEPCAILAPLVVSAGLGSTGS